MAAIGTLPVVLGTGDHASRPAASAVGAGGLYSCTTHSLVYQTDGSSWSTWATLGSALPQGLDTTDSPQFAGINLGHASDTTLTRVSAGVVAIEGTNIVKAGAATGSGLTMATARLLGRTTASTGAVEEITVGSGLSLAAGSLSATGGGTPTFSGAKVYNAGTQTINSSSFTALTFGAEEFDTNSYHDTGSDTSRLTAPSNGYYLVQGGTFASNGNVSWIGFRQGGSTDLRGYTTFSGGGYRVVQGIFQLSATNYLEIGVSTSASVDFGHATIANAQSWFSMVLLGS